MNTSIANQAPTGYPFGRIALALAVGFAIGLVPLRSAIADHQDGDDRGRREHEQRHRSHHEHHPVYAPPSVYYPRHESPGISLFLPFDIR